MRNNIAVGDKVDIELCSGESLTSAEVLYIPCCEGDCWHVKNNRGNLIYVMKFNIMFLVGEDESKPEVKG